MNKATWGYVMGGAPKYYVCSECGDKDCKLWRPPHCELPLRCARCVAKKEEENIVFDRFGRAPSSWRSGYLSESTLHCLPAFPCEGESMDYWGHTSTPDDAVLWWRMLPTYSDKSHKSNISTTLALFERAREENPYLYFELACLRSTDWMCWVIDHSGGERKVLATGQGTYNVAVDVAYQALLKLLRKEESA